MPGASAARQLQCTRAEEAVGAAAAVAAKRASDGELAARAAKQPRT